jgi:hypothetical protein
MRERAAALSLKLLPDPRNQLSMQHQLYSAYSIPTAFRLIGSMISLLHRRWQFIICSIIFETKEI